MRTQGGLFSVGIDHGLEAVDAADTVIVPEAEGLPAPAPSETLEALRRAYDRGARLVSFCSGAFTLAAAGVLDGRRATTHWMYAGDLARAYPRVAVDPGVLFVDEGQVLTSAGTAAGIDLSLHIVRRDHGARVARQVARSMVVPPQREGGQAQFIVSPLPAPTGPYEGVRRAMDHALEHLDEPLGLPELAHYAHMSARNFSRRFREVTGTTPNRWILSRRLARVRELLEETDETVERIAQLTGFGSAVTLRQRFAAELHTSPTAYRRSFRPAFGADPIPLRFGRGVPA
jgi:AraC family transcriptional activator FtrA